MRLPNRCPECRALTLDDECNGCTSAGRYCPRVGCGLAWYVRHGDDGMGECPAGDYTPEPSDLDATARAHAAGSGSHCLAGPDGTCQGCGVAMVECPDCHGIGYHLPDIMAPQCYTVRA